MVLSRFVQRSAPAARPDDVAALIAKKDYKRAIEVIRNQLGGRAPDPRLRLQLGDVLAMAGRPKEAVQVLLPLADEYAREGFAAKAISVLKKIQRIDPAQREVGARLASLIEEKQKQATVAMPAAAPSPSFEIGMEEIGFDPPMGGGVNVPAGPAVARYEPEPVPAPQPAPVPARAPAPPEREAEPVPDFGFEAPEGGLDLGGGGPDLGLSGDDLELPGDDRAPASQPAPAHPRATPTSPAAAPAPPRAAAPPPAPVEDRDLYAGSDDELLTIETLEPDVEIEPEPEIHLDADAELPPEPLPAEEGLPEMSEGLFAEELLSLVEGAFKDVALADHGGGTVASDGERSTGGNQIVVSPLFHEMAVDEMVAVIQGLNLLTFEPGDIILTEGDPGDSLYMLSSGTVKALKKNSAGRQVTVAELDEGAFFGEGSILTGQPRSATVVATTPCELLELDRPTLDRIVQQHPRVWQILEEFAAARQNAPK